jgi:hypothetical protein
MTTTMWSRRTFSIATDGLEVFTGDEVTTIMGGLIMDLVSAPIKPGIYNIRLTALMGGIRIFFPRMLKWSFMAHHFWVASGYIVVMSSGISCRRHSLVPTSKCRQHHLHGHAPHTQNTQ